MKADLDQEKDTFSLSNDELLKELSEATEIKTPANNSFSPEEPELGQQAKEPNNEAVPQEPEQEPIFEYDESAKLLIASIDMLNGFVLPGLYKKKHFTWEERERVTELIDLSSEKGKNKTDLDEKDLKLMNKIVKFEEYQSSLPFTERDISYLQPSFAAVLQKYKFKPSPMTALMFSIGVVMAPRIAPLF